MIDSGAVKFGWKILNWTWDKRDAIRKRLAEVSGWYRKNAAKNILILGEGGTGKSTLGKLLSGDYDLLLDAPESYRESIAVERVKIVAGASRKTKRKSSGAEAVIAPGQQHRRLATWTDQLRGITDGKYRGLILVSSYGYHSLGLSVLLHKLYHKQGPGAFLPRYLKSERDREVKTVRDLANHIAMNRHPMWLLSLITKRDLWWPQELEVQRFYSDGSYGAEIKKLIARKDPKQFRHELLLVSLTISNFLTSEGELLQSNVAGYDDGYKAKSMRQLFETLDALRNWELS